MFTTPNLPTLLKRVTFKLVEQPGADAKARMAEVAAVLDPFTPDLARELGKDVAGHLFDGADAMLPGVRDIRLDVPPLLQRVTVRWARDLAVEAVFDEVVLRALQVTRVETADDAWYRATLGLHVPLRDAEAQALARVFGALVALTFEAHQRPLFAATLARGLAQQAQGGLPEGVESLTVRTPGQAPVTYTRDEFASAAQALREA